MATHVLRHFCKNRAAIDLGNFKTIPKPKVCQRTFTSALFVTGDQAHKTFAYLTPEIDFNDRINNLQKLQYDIDSRGLEINAEELSKKWHHYQYIISNKNSLQQKLTSLTNKVVELKKIDSPSSEEEQQIEALITQCKLVKQDLKTVKEAAWEIEKTVIPEILKVPNEVDEDTPSQSSTVIKSVGKIPEDHKCEWKSHLDIGKRLDLLDYRNPVHFFLCNEAAVFELGVLAMASKIMSEYSFYRVSGPDFCRSVVVEGSGMDHESSSETFILKNTDNVEQSYLINRLHLVGGASLPALLAQQTKTVSRRKFFPVKMFTSGRQYTPFPKTSATYGLFTVCQASALQALAYIVDNNGESCSKEFENLVNITSRIYDNIGCHYRIVLKCAKELEISERKRVSFEMWSAYSKQYVEVGHVSACGDYFSKRLLIGCQSTEKMEFPSTITGTLLSVPRVLGCMLEENPEEFLLPDTVAKSWL
ncbi:hypothetical protein QAD02_023240 [Eretmocerus hayati]|uniref:Uncharacterized protein n=1 Tax=Eretmocerus hayati TaxID=131215 RepID=A0ACC2PXF2_9HYME|nr:hypothetical protein QAD02_023240 [Eretmocerus hayati]